VKIDDYETEVLAYAVEITRFLLSRGAGLQDAEDCVQEALVKILEYDQLVRPDRLRSFLYQTAINTYINRYRRKQHYDRIIESLQQELKNLHAQPESLEIQDLISQLKPDQAKLIRAFYFDRLSIKQIAEKFALSPSKVKIQLYRGRKKLRKLLNE